LVDGEPPFTQAQRHFQPLLGWRAIFPIVEDQRRGSAGEVIAAQTFCYHRFEALEAWKVAACIA
jgi:hypothetical protein